MLAIPTFSPMRLLSLMAVLTFLLSCVKDNPAESGDPARPVIGLPGGKDLQVTAEAGSGVLDYTLSNAPDGAVVSAECDSPWVRLQDIEQPGILPFTYEENTDAGSRSAVITLSFQGADDVEVSLVQSGTEKLILEVSVSDPGAFSAGISVTATQKDMTYAILNLTEEAVSGFSSDGELTEYYVELFKTVAGNYNMTLEAFLETLLYKGDVKGTIDDLSPETDYVIVSFGLTTGGVVTSEVFRTAYSTSSVPFYADGVEMGTSLLRPNYAEISSVPGQGGYRYYADVISEEELSSFQSLDEFADMIISELKNIIDMNNAFGNPMTWKDLTEEGESSFVVNTLYSDSQYSAYAFGLENGYRLTDVSVMDFTTPVPSVTDDCTFSVEVLSSDPELTEVKIVPSDNNTEYFAAIALSSEANSMTPERFADDCIVYANQFDTWVTFSGEKILEASGLSSDTDYTVVVFGVGDYYERNTDVNYFTVHTSSHGKLDISFDLEITSKTRSSVSFNCSPSDLQQTWTVGAVKADRLDSFSSDEEFAEFLKTSGNGFPILHTGEDSGSLMYDCEWGMLSPGDYYLYAVACYSDGISYEVLSDFTYMPFTLEERKLGSAGVELSLTVYKGDDLVAYDSSKYPSSEYAGKAAVLATCVPDQACTAYYVCQQARSAESMGYLDMDTLIDYVIKNLGLRVEGNASSSYLIALPWNAVNNCLLALGVDAEGLESKPVIVSLGVSEDQSVPFSPTSEIASALSVPASVYPAGQSVSVKSRMMSRNVPYNGISHVALPYLSFDKSMSYSKSGIVEKHVVSSVRRAGAIYFNPAERSEYSRLLREVVVL